MQDLRKGAKTGSNALIFRYKGGSGQKNRRRGSRRRKGRDTIYCVFRFQFSPLILTEGTSGRIRSTKPLSFSSEQGDRLPKRTASLSLKFWRK